MRLKTTFFLVILIISGGCSPASSQPSSELPPPYWEQMYAHHDKAASECASGENCEVEHAESSEAQVHDPNKKATLILEYSPFFP